MDSNLKTALNQLSKKASGNNGSSDDPSRILTKYKSVSGDSYQSVLSVSGSGKLYAVGSRSVLNFSGGDPLYLKVVVDGVTIMNTGVYLYNSGSSQYTQYGSIGLFAGVNLITYGDTGVFSPLVPIACGIPSPMDDSISCVDGTTSGYGGTGCLRFIQYDKPIRFEKSLNVYSYRNAATSVGTQVAYSLD